MSRFVLDSYAMLASYWLEPGHVEVRRLLASQRDECWMSVINLGEMFYRIAREEGLPSAQRALLFVGRLPVRFVDAGWKITQEAALIKSQYAISYADCFAAALARQLSAAVVTGDPEFEQLEAEGVVAVSWLPDVPKRRR